MFPRKYAYMRTTLDLPDETFRQLKSEAALRGKKLKDLLAEFIEKGLAARYAKPLGPRTRSALPIVRPATGVVHPSLSNAEIEHLLGTEDSHA